MILKSNLYNYNNWPVGVGFLRKYLTSKAMPEIKTYVFLDLETTGLPYMEHNSTKITELCAIAVQADHIELGCFPRVHNKLSLCFNPKKMISPESTTITGLSNELLENQVDFSSEVVDILKKWLEMNRKPICLVAHNGNRFDYPILRAEIEKTGNDLPSDILCVDSLIAFKQIDCQEEARNASLQRLDFNDDIDDQTLWDICEQFDQSVKSNSSECSAQQINETTPKKQIIKAQPRVNRKQGNVAYKRKLHKLSYKLGDVYTRLTDKEAINAHEAEADVIMLLTCAAVYGEKFVAYADRDSKPFLEIPPMKPGKRIGT